MHTRKKGAQAEELAAKYLKQSGYEILERNFIAKRGEMDIVARDKKGTIVCVEVKLRGSHIYGDATESVGRTKLRCLYQALKTYLMKNNLSDDTDVRVDIIEVDARKQIRHIMDIES